MSVIIPAYNESNRIGKTLVSIERYFKKKKLTYEIIVVDDGSKDKTIEVVNKYAAKNSNIKIVSNGINRGKGYSVKHGMGLARGGACLFMDADNSVDISHLEIFWEHMKHGFPVVIGSIHIGTKKAVDRNGWHRRVLGELANYLIRTMATPSIKDTQRGFKLFSAEAAHYIFQRQTIERFGFDIEVLVIARKAGFKIKEVPVTWDNPGNSTVTLTSYISTLRELIKITLNRVSGRYNAL